MKSENIYILAASVWMAFATFSLLCLYSPATLEYWYVHIPIDTIVYYYILTGDHIKYKRKSATNASIGLGAFLLYSLILFHIEKDAFRDNFLLYSLPFIAFVFGMIFIYRKYYLPKEVKKNEKPE